MLDFDDSDGSIVIQFANGPVRVRPPTFGGLKRLRSERVRLAREAQDKALAWENEHPVPDGPVDDETGEQGDADALAVARRAEDRIIAVEEANLQATEAWWRLVLVGDESFQKLAEGPVPENVDDWPAFLLYDIRPVIPPNSSLDVILSAQSTPDRVVRHWGEGRSRSGRTNGAGPTTTT